MCFVLNVFTAEDDHSSYTYKPEKSHPTETDTCEDFKIEENVDSSDEDKEDTHSQIDASADVPSSLQPSVVLSKAWMNRKFFLLLYISLGCIFCGYLISVFFRI